MPVCSLITKDYNCLLEVARTPSTALRAWATHVLALSQETKLAASAIVGQQSSQVTRYRLLEHDTSMVVAARNIEDGYDVSWSPPKYIT